MRRDLGADTLTAFKSTSWFFRHPAESISGVILLLMAANLISLAAGKAITNDEVVHIPPGYSYLTRQDFRLNPEHPSLIKMWASLPLLLLRPEPGSTANPSQEWGERTLSTSTNFWHQNRTHFKAISFWARLPVIFLTLALGILIFVYGRQLFGSRAAVFSVALFSLEPTMLGHGWIVHTDIAAALGYLLFFFWLQAYCRTPTFWRAVCFGLATAFALLTKFSLIIIVPIFVAGLAYAVWRKTEAKYSPRRTALYSILALTVTVIAINAAYFFRHPILAPADAAFVKATLPLFPAITGFFMRMVLKIKLLRKIPTEKINTAV